MIQDYDCIILEGHRSKARQLKLYAQGKTKTLKSKHLTIPSLAVDVAPYPLDWNNLTRFYNFGGYVLGVANSFGIDLRWGGDWDSDFDFKDQSFNDLVHFELRNR